MNVCLLLLCMWMTMHLRMFYVQSFQFLWMHMFMGLVSRIVNSMVASSSPVEGSGTLHCGIRAHVATWAWMDHEDVVTEARFPSAQQRSQIYDRKFLENFVENLSKCLNLRPIGRLSGKLLRCSGDVDGRSTDGGSNLWIFSKWSSAIGESEWKLEPQFWQRIAEDRRNADPF